MEVLHRYPRFFVTPRGISWADDLRELAGKHKQWKREDLYRTPYSDDYDDEGAGNYDTF